MKKRMSKTAVYNARCGAASVTLREPLHPDGEPMSVSIKMHPEFQGQLRLRGNGTLVVIQSKDAESGESLLRALQEALGSRDMDERRWLDKSEVEEKGRKET